LSVIEYLPTLLLFILLIAISYVDIQQMRIPDELNITLFIVGLASVLFLGRMTFQWAIFSSIAGALLPLLVRWSYLRIRDQIGLGLGDVKFLAASAVWVGLECMPKLILISSVAALIWIGGIYSFGYSIKFSDRIPFGPFLALGLWIVWIGVPILGI